MVCLHRQKTNYESRLLELQVQGVTRKIPVGLEEDLLYLMILGWDWSEIYDILVSLCPSQALEAGLLGVRTESEESLTLEG